MSTYFRGRLTQEIAESIADAIAPGVRAGLILGDPQTVEAVIAIRKIVGLYVDDGEFEALADHVLGPFALTEEERGRMRETILSDVNSLINKPRHKTGYHFARTAKEKT